MKTPEEIKKGLEHCHYGVGCSGCVYELDCLGMGDCRPMLMDVYNYINRIEERERQLFDLLSGTWFTKARYFKQEDGTVYSRVPGEYMTFEQAIDEFTHELTDEAQVPKWISVEERLPENEKPVLIVTKWGFMGKCGLAVSCGMYTNGKTFTGDSDYNWNDGDVELDYNEEEDEYIVPEGWWESVRYTEHFSAVDEPVLYWMPLPEPPKEG